jgi:hypothetical protein
MVCLTVVTTCDEGERISRFEEEEVEEDLD